MAELQKTGVEAIVEGLGSFLSDVDSMNSKIGEIGAKGNLLTRALGGAWEMLENFGASVVHVAEYALGQLLADAIEAVLSKIKELISATIQAGAEFQTMELRLNRLNFNSVADSVGDYGEAMDKAKQMTQEQLTWLQRLAVATPYDAQDIANVFTLAQSYGFAADQAKGLTQDITDFAAGMGLGNTEIERIIVNFGQMVQQGKVTQREMNDLARGSFVPVNDILDIMRKKTGLTGTAFDAFRNSGEGVNLFMESFSKLAKDRFQGAASDMAKTFQGATANAQDFVKSLLGFGVVRPVLNEIGAGIAGFISALTEPGRWDALTQAAGRVGESFSLVLRILEEVMGLNVDSLADGIVDGLNGIADWVNLHRGDIYTFFTTVRDKVKEVWEALKARDFEGFLKAIGLDDAAIDKITAFKDGIVEAFNTIKGWVDENGPLIKKFFETLGEIAGGVFQNFAGGDGGGGLESFLDLLRDVMLWVIDHQENFTSLITLLVQLQIFLAIIGVVAAAIAGPIMAFIGFLFTIGELVLFVVGVIAFLTTGVGLLALAVVGVIVAWSIWGDTVTAVMSNGIAIIGEFLTRVKDGFVDFSVNAVQAFQDGLNIIQTKVEEWSTTVVQKFIDFSVDAVAAFQDGVTILVQKAQELIDKIKAKFKGVNWAEIGRGIIQGIINGITNAVGALVDAVGNAVQSAVKAAQESLKAKSPSKVFMEIGEGTMEGMAMGITKMAGLASSSMEKAMAQVAMPAFAMSGGVAASMVTNNTSNTNFGLTINSSAPVEPILQDFDMLKSLAGA